MKRLTLALLSVATLHGQTCQGIDVGSSVYGPSGHGISWHGFVAGSAASTYRQNIASASVNSHSAAWIAQTAFGGTWYGQQLTMVPAGPTSDFQGYTWESQTYHYVHGNTARRVPIQPSPGPVYSDPGTVPVPPYPLIEGSFGSAGSAIPPPVANSGAYYPNSSRPFGFLLDIYRGPLSDPNGAIDRQLHIIDVDSCMEFDAYNCVDNTLIGGTGLSCGPAGWFYLAGGDAQRPYNNISALGGDSIYSNTSSVSAVHPGMGSLRWDEYDQALNHGVPIAHALNITGSPSHIEPAFTGPALYAQYSTGAWDSTTPPLGAKLRLKSTFDRSLVAASCGPLLDVMQNYGLVYVDGGESGTLAAQQTSGVPGWPFDCVISLASTPIFPFFTAANFDFVDQPENRIFCAEAATGCPDTVPTGGLPSIGAFTINGSSSATISLAANGTATLAWSVNGVVDFNNDPLPQRFISWGPNNRFGPGPINAFIHGEHTNVTVCAASACDFSNTGTYAIQLLVMNRFGIAKRTVTLTVSP